MIIIRLSIAGFLLKLLTTITGVVIVEDHLADAVHNSCPCMRQKDVAPFAAGAIPHDPHVNLTAYGVGCHKHDEDYKNCIDGRNPGSWCKNEWCWIDPQNCDLRHSHSFFYENSNRFYSYAACGYTDDFIRDPSRIYGETLVAVVQENHRGYQGTICPRDPTPSSPDDGDCYGTVISLVKFLMEVSNLNLTIEYTYIPESIKSQAKKYPAFIANGENMVYGSCVYATSMSVIDLCIGAYTKNRQRTAVSPFIEMGVTSEFLIVSQKNDKDSVWVNIKSVFQPFTAELWLISFAIIFLLSLIFMVQESKLSLTELFHTDQCLETVTNAVYNGALRFWGSTAILSADGEEGVTWGGRCTLLAICVHLLLTINSYTANLTNFLVRMSAKSSISSMKEAIAQKKKVCVLRNKIAVLDMAFGKNNIRYASSPVDGELGFMKRTELLEAMDNNLCSCTVASMEELSTYHGDGQHCDKYKIGDPVIELPWGIPVSDRYEAPLTTAMSRMMQNGKWREIVDEQIPESRCSAEASFGDDQQLTPNKLLGAYVLSAALVLFGAFFTILGKCIKPRKPNARRSGRNRKRRRRSREGRKEGRRKEELSTEKSTRFDVNAHMVKLRKDLASLEEAVAPHIDKRETMENCSLDEVFKNE